MKINLTTYSFANRNTPSLQTNKSVSFRAGYNMRNCNAGNPDNYSQIKILSEEEHHKLEHDLKKPGEERDKARGQLILSFIPLVCRISQKYIKCFDKGIYSDDDIIQQGIIGLTKSVDKFDIDKGVDFTKFVEYGINSQIIKELKYKNIIRLPRLKRKLFIDAMKTYSDLYEKKLYAPSNEEIAKVLNVPVKQIDEVLSAGQKTLPMTFVNKDGEESEEIIPDNKQLPVCEIVDDKLRKEELKENLKAELKRLLKPNYYKVISLHYGLDGEKPINTVDISKMLNTTRTNVYLLEKKAFARIKSSGKVKKLYEEYVKDI